VNSPKQSERRELWRHRIAQQQESGQTVRAFCLQHQLKEHSFYWWRKQLSSSAEQPIRFALVETAAPDSGRRQEPLELLLAGGERLHIPADAATLRMVLGVLRDRE
jgi:hypothetical protein